MQYSPLQTLPVSYTISDPTDGTLYFVQSVLRDTSSNKILQVVNLTRDSSYHLRYEGVFQPIADPQGLGRPVDITTSVFTDALYTVPSPNYQLVNIPYLILQPPIFNSGFGGAGGSDWETLLELIRFELGKKPKGDKKFSIIANKAIDYKKFENILGSSGYAKSKEISEFAAAMKLLHEGSISRINKAHEKSYSSMSREISEIRKGLEKQKRMDVSLTKEMTRQMNKAMTEALSGMNEIPEAFIGKMEDKLSGVVKELMKTISESFGEKQIHFNIASLPKPEKKIESRWTPQNVEKLI